MALVVLGVLATLWIAAQLRTLIFIVFIALFVAVALEPAVQFLSKRGWPRRIATVVVFLGTYLVVAGFAAALVPLFVTQASELTDNLPAYLENVQSFIDEQQFFDIELVDPQVDRQLNNLGDLIENYGGDVAGGVFAVGNTVFGALFRVVTITLFAYYMVAEGPEWRRTVLAVLPQRRQREVLRIWEIAVDKTGGYVYSRFVLALVAAAFTAGVLRLLDVPFSLALGMWVGVLSQFVPVVGTYIAAVLPVLVALFQSPATAAWVLLALIAYQQVENFLVAPRITAKAMAIHPAVSVGSVIAGASILGGIGAVLALPVTATIQAFISTAIERHELIESEALVEPPRGPRSGKHVEEKPADPL